MRTGTRRPSSRGMSRWRSGRTRGAARSPAPRRWRPRRGSPASPTSRSTKRGARKSGGGGGRGDRGAARFNKKQAGRSPRRVTCCPTPTGAAGTATQVVFSVEPSDAVAGAAIARAVQVAAQDAHGDTATEFTGNVTVAIGTNPGSGTLAGTATVAASAGVASFANLSIDKVGTGYTLTATGAGSATSAAFNITAGGGAAHAFARNGSSRVGGEAGE